MAKKQPMYGSEASAGQDAIADVAATYAATGMDGSTDMSAAEGAKIVADIAALIVAVNGCIAALEEFGILET